VGVAMEDARAGLVHDRAAAIARSTSAASML
jgi:hypothetical protein